MNYLKIRREGFGEKGARYVFFTAPHARTAFRQACRVAEQIGDAAISVWASVEGVPGEVPLIGEPAEQTAKQRRAA